MDDGCSRLTARLIDWNGSFNALSLGGRRWNDVTTLKPKTSVVRHGRAGQTDFAARLKGKFTTDHISRWMLLATPHRATQPLNEG